MSYAYYGVDFMNTNLDKTITMIAGNNTELVVDLFSGLGGWSQKFIENKNFYVNRFDVDPWLADVPCTIIADLKEYKIVTSQKPHLLIASPPCYEFSLAHSAPRAIANREGRPYYPDVSLIKIFKEHLDRLKPKYWIMENVKGSAEFVNWVLGERPRQIIGPYLLWGNFPLLDLTESELKEIKEHKKKAGDKHRWSDHRGSYRAFIPEPMSKALMRSVSSPTLEDWL
jgi:site-specific DNA-cytosine methylase